MAIIFTKDISTNVLTAYNNHIIQFASNSIKTPKYATVSVGSQNTVIYPLPSGVFWFNYFAYTPYLINSNNFDDQINPNISGLDPNDYIYLGNAGKYLNFNSVIEITFTDDTTDTATRELQFIAGVQQIEDVKKDQFVLNTNFFALLPFQIQSNVTYYARYYRGYPFDISYFNYAIASTTLLNQRNLDTITFDSLQRISRIFISDGETDMGVQNLLSLAEGLNPLKLTSGSDNIYIDLDIYENTCGGVYVKWMNRLGGWSYWLFSDYYRRSRSYKNIGEVNNDFLNVADTYAPTKQIGKVSNDTIEVIEENLNERDLNFIKDILESPKVQIFTGQPFSRGVSTSWLDVAINTSKAIIKDYKNEPISIKFSFDLPDRYNITL